MADPFVAEIRLFAGNFAPKGWAFCDGQLIPISQNTALFALMGVTYGGDGKTTFALPDLRGRAPLQHGQGNGLTPRAIGQSGGQTTVKLTANHLPAHDHGPLRVHDTAATSNTPSAARSLARSSISMYGAPTKLAAMGDKAGGGAAHENRQPFLGLSFIIALQGIFPAKS